MWNDEALNADYASIYMDQIGSKTHIGGGLVRFGNMGARSWQDKITFRAGAFRESYSLKYSGKTINENGLSIGFDLNSPPPESVRFLLSDWIQIN